MTVELDEKVSQKVKEVAKDLGLTTDEVVQQIIEWYIEDCENA